jgi:hypothetical protein
MLRRRMRDTAAQITTSPVSGKRSQSLASQRERDSQGKIAFPPTGVG